MTSARTTGLSVVALTISACISTGAVAGGLNDYRGSYKDTTVVQHVAPASPCYFRGDVGYSVATSPTLSWPVNSITNTYDGTDPGNPGNLTGTTTTYVGSSVSNVEIQNSWLGEVGIGCGSGSRGFRVDATIGLRGARDIDGEPQDFTVTDVYTGTTVDTPVDGDPMHFSLTTYTMMVNVYKDLGKWGRMVPYIGAGVGVAYHKVGDVSFTDNVNLTNSIAGNNDLSFAWSLMAGFGYQISNRMILDVGYRYINMGQIESGRVDSAGFTNPAVKIDDIDAHEFKVGLRYHFGGSNSY